MTWRSGLCTFFCQLNKFKTNTGIFIIRGTGDVNNKGMTCQENMRIYIPTQVCKATLSIYVKI